ncbi:MAG: DUF4397 domain-containing protein [Anaerolineae bacterium]|nr:DUF4397 domain-containing protein [Chloroflexota bacterium]MBN8636505.1 DUF4397 domain-containing protein [Anaerolineae bacterium]
MQRLGNSARLNGKFGRWAWMGLVLVCLLLFGVSVTTAQSEGAQIRVGHFVFDAPAVNLYVNGELVMGTDDMPLLYGVLTLPTDYLDVAAGTHTFAVTAEDEPLESALVGAQEFTLEAGHRYTLALMGNVSLGDLHFLLLDETAAVAEKDITQSAVTFFINNVTGVSALDFVFAGEPVITNLAYGDYQVMQDPAEGSGSLVTDSADPTAVLLEVPEAVGSPAHFLAVFVFSGTFSGAQWEGYDVLYTGQFEGELTILDGGPIALGETLPVEFTDMGQRMQFTLTLAEPTVVDILESGSVEVDPFVRIYDAAGSLLYSNDELSMEDNAEGIGDAGCTACELDAGTYIIEAATFIDIGTGEFTLTVSEAE